MVTPQYVVLESTSVIWRSSNFHFQETLTLSVPELCVFASVLTCSQVGWIVSYSNSIKLPRVDDGGVFFLFVCLLAFAICFFS